MSGPRRTCVGHILRHELPLVQEIQHIHLHIVHCEDSTSSILQGGAFHLSRQITIGQPLSGKRMPRGGGEQTWGQGEWGSRTCGGGVGRDEEWVKALWSARSALARRGEPRKCGASGARAPPLPGSSLNHARLSTIPLSSCGQSRWLIKPCKLPFPRGPYKIIRVEKHAVGEGVPG